MTLGRRRFAASPCRFVAAACGASPDPVYYTIATRTGPDLPAGPKIVLLKDIGLASYLDRREIVRSSEGYKLDVMANDWWGEPLGGMLGRVLVVELVAAPAQQHGLRRKRRHHRATPTPSSASTSSASTPTRPARCILLAQVAVEFNRPRRLAARTFTISKPLPTPEHRRAWWRRSAMPWASWPTASPRCCSLSIFSAARPHRSFHDARQARARR